MSDPTNLPSLYNFIIFNPTLCKKEGEENEKILFYHCSEKISVGNKVRQVGLCEGLINFASKFSSTPCEALHTKKTRQVYFDPEPDFWMVMTAKIPERGCRYISNLTLRSLLIMSYDLFTIFYGTFTSLMKSLQTTDELRLKLRRFFDPYKSTLKIGESEILDHVAGAKFLSLDSTTYLCAQRFLNCLKDRHQPVLYTVLIYKDKLIFSDLNKHDTKVLYHYLINILFPAQLDTSDMEFISKSLQTVGRYLNGPDNFDEGIKASRLHLRTGSRDGNLTQVFLLVYNNLNTTLCLMIDAKISCTKNFYKSLDSFLSSNVPQFDDIISKQVLPRQGGTLSITPTLPHASTMSDSIRCFFFNYDNLAYISTLHNPPYVATVFMRIVCELVSDIRHKRTADVLVKTNHDMWISARKSSGRLLFTLILQKNTSIITVVEELKRLSAQMFCRSYFTPV